MGVTVTDFLYSLPVVAAAVYFLVHVRFAAALVRYTAPERSVRLRISVVVAARNEERTIGRLLEALSAQTTPPEEIIVVNDRSDDDTSAILRQHASGNVRLKVVDIHTVPDGMAPKKHAMERGVETATGDIILCTDADCVPPRAWVERMSDAFGPRTAAVIGTYVPRSRSGSAGLVHRLFTAFVRYERFRMTVHGIGAAAAGSPWLASGASFAYRKAVFERLGGFDTLHRSLGGDDDLLVQRIWDQTDELVGVVPYADAAVETDVPSTFGAFLHQRLRHGSATRYYLPKIKVRLALYHLTNIISLLAFPLALVTGSAMMLAAYAVKVSADILLFVIADSRLHRSSDWFWFIPLEFLYVLYSITISPLGYLKRTVRWEA